MTNSAPARRRASSRISRSAMVLTGAMLVAAPLVAPSSPAMAADIDPTVYGSEQDVLAAMESLSPVNPTESVMGYPKGIDLDESGNVKPVTRGDVEGTYDPAKAVADAKEVARKYADDTNNPQVLREAIKPLADSTITDPEVGQNTTDDQVLPVGAGLTSRAACEGRWPYSDADQNAAKAGACMFVGKLDTRDGSKYPKLGSSSGLLGGGKKTYTVSGQVTDEKSETSGWSVGGKFTPKVTMTPAGDNGGAGGEVGGEASFTYSYSSTTVNRVTSTTEDKTEVEFPSDKKGSLQGRRDGAYYVGYIIVDSVEDTDYGSGTEHLKAIPARVYVQSPTTSTPVSYFKYQEPASK